MTGSSDCTRSYRHEKERKISMTEREKKNHSWTAQMDRCYGPDGKEFREIIDGLSHKYNFDYHYAFVGTFHWAIYSILLMFGKFKFIDGDLFFTDPVTRDDIFIPFYASNRITDDPKKRYIIEGIFNIISLCMLLFYSIAGIAYFFSGSSDITGIFGVVNNFLIIGYVGMLIASIILQARPFAHFVNAVILIVLIGLLRPYITFMRTNTFFLIIGIAAGLIGLFFLLLYELGSNKDCTCYVKIERKRK